MKDNIREQIDEILGRSIDEYGETDPKLIPELIALIQESNRQARESAEYWKPYDAYYDVSTLGRVRRNERILKQSYRFKGGYPCVTLSIANKQKSVNVHRLVAHVFLPNPKGLDCVNHIDGDKTNNLVTNLEWCTYQENERHSFDVLGKVPHNKGTMRRLTTACVGCGAEVTDRRTRKYCSRECYQQNQTKALKDHQGASNEAN